MKVFFALLEDQRWLYDIFDISLSIFEKIESVKMFLIEYTAAVYQTVTIYLPGPSPCLAFP